MTRAERFPALTTWESLDDDSRRDCTERVEPLYRAACWEAAAERAILDGYPGTAIHCKRAADAIADAYYLPDLEGPDACATPAA